MVRLYNHAGTHSHNGVVNPYLGASYIENCNNTSSCKSKTLTECCDKSTTVKSALIIYLPIITHAMIIVMWLSVLAVELSLVAAFSKLSVSFCAFCSANIN